MNGSCWACRELGPPPDSILTIPPPPLPAFLQLAPLTNHSAPLCQAPCDWSTAHGVEFVELPRQGSAVVDDTWLLVLISCSVGVLLLGSLLALILLKCREERSSKAGAVEKSGLYGGALWATLTPRGTTTHHLAHSLLEDYPPRRVSSPTRIENPNLPPLNLHRSLRRPPADHTPVL